MIIDIFRNGFTPQLIINLLVRVFVMFCVLPVHEFAHALTANALGDKTAKLKGRLTLNPLAHVDVFGCLLVLIAGFGYAKPVPVNPRNFKNPKGGMALTAVAGPLSNLIMAFCWVIAYSFTIKSGIYSENSFKYYLAFFFLQSCMINISLAVFNLLPVPPLDGSRLLQLIIPDKYYFRFARYERYMVYAVLILVFVGVLDRPMAFCTEAIYSVLQKAASAIAGV